MTHVFLFDVDGTLTPKGSFMSEDLAQQFQKLSKRAPTFISTSRTYDDLREQLPVRVLNMCGGVFTCSGSEYWENGSNVYRKNFIFEPILREACEKFVQASNFRHKMGFHVLRRPGKLCVSVVGLRAPMPERLRYRMWDRATSERRHFMTILNESQLAYDAYIGTNTCIEILPNDQNKSMVAEELARRYPGQTITFFADRIGQFGSDLPLAEKLLEISAQHRVISVGSDEHTKRHIERLLSGKALLAS